MSAVNTIGRNRPAASPRAAELLIAHGWGRGLLDVGAQALMRGLATAFPRCVRGCPCLTAGVERIGHIACWREFPLPWPRPRPCPGYERRTGSDAAGQAGCASRATAHMKAASSRAIAVQVTVVFLPRAVSAR